LASIVSKQLLQGQHVVRIDFGDAREANARAINATCVRAVGATHRGVMTNR
jgi:hypothetical protein